MSFEQRLLVGRRQIFGQHVLALVANTAISEEIAIAMSYLQSPVDQVRAYD